MTRPINRFGLAMIWAASLSSPSLAGGLFSTDGVSNWQGGYIGLHGGAGLGTAGSLTTGGTVYGAHGGMNIQSGQFVGGLEGDFDSSQVKNSSTSESFTQSWTASSRGRGGYSFGTNLAYGTVGVAISGTNYTNVNSTDAIKYGVVYGAGIETFAMQNVVLRGEFLHYDLAASNYLANGSTVSLDTKTNLFRFGISYKF